MPVLKIGPRSLKSLQEIDVSHTQVDDFTVLKELKSLQKISCTAISCVRSLKGLEDLKSLSVSGALLLLEPTDRKTWGPSDQTFVLLSVFKTLKNLVWLDLSKTLFADVSILRELKNLSSLDLSNTQVSDVTALTELKNLVFLNLNGTNVSDVNALKELKGLRYLGLMGTKVSDADVANLRATLPLKSFNDLLRK